VIPKELETQILRLHFAEKWRIGTIASQVGVHHSTVRRVLGQHGVPSPSQRRSMLDPYRGFVDEQLRRWPTLPASVLFGMLQQRGYPGRPDHVRHMVARVRPRPAAEAYLRLRTLPGEQAQVDWAHFGTVQIGRATRPLVAFVMVLSYSRRLFLRFDLAQRMESFLRGHEACFAEFGGVARVLLYDNLKSAVLERAGDAIRFHPTLLDFATHYRFEPRAAAPYRGNEKGRVERAIRYVRSSFFLGRAWKDLDDLNAQAHDWCGSVANERAWPQDRSRTVGAVWQEEKAQLLPLPESPYPTEERVEVHVGKTPYLRFDRNDYSIPHSSVRRTLTVLASKDRVRVLQGATVLAEHRRSYDQGQQIEDLSHIADLVAHKRAAREHRGLDRLSAGAPRSADLLAALAKDGANLGAAVSHLLRLLDRFGGEELATAVSEALDSGTPSPHSVRLVLERRRRERGLPPPIAIPLPADPRVRDLVVRPHALSDYDHLEDRDDDASAR
jgi:transposase